MISIVLPAYLEAENLGTILPRIKEALKDMQYEILVVDTMEPMDETPIVCKANQVRYIAREGGNNYGDAIRTGFKKAEGEYIVIMDADGSHNPESIKEFYTEMKTNKYDLIIGSRYCKGGYTDNPAILRFMSWMLNVAYRMIFGLRVKDVSDSYRMYKANQVKNIDLECQNFDIVEEVLIKLNLTFDNFKIKEVPIVFNKREAGESKRDLKKFIMSYFVTIKKLLAIKKSMKKQ